MLAWPIGSNVSVLGRKKGKTEEDFFSSLRNLFEAKICISMFEWMHLISQSGVRAADALREGNMR